MKIQEVRDTIKNYKKEELMFIIGELYKAIPKDKKEDSQIDSIIQKPIKSKDEPTSKKKKVRSIDDIISDINNFDENARAQNYLGPNRVISKADRPKWRFLVKNLYKEVIAAEVSGDNKAVCAGALRKLYEVLTYACDYTLFSAYDPFESVGIAQSDFFNQIIKFYRDSLDIEDFIPIGIKLIVENSLNRYTLYSELMNIFLDYCNTNDVKELVIEKAKKLLSEINLKPQKTGRSFFLSDSDMQEFRTKEKYKNIVELITRTYCLLYDYNSAVKYYNDYYFENTDEIKLFVLVRILFSYKNHEIILKVINDKIKLPPRKSLLDLKAFIEKNNKLPEYIG